MRRKRGRLLEFLTTDKSPHLFKNPVCVCVYMFVCEMCHRSVLPLYPCSRASTILSHSRQTMHICLMNRVGRWLKGEQLCLGSNPGSAIYEL